MAACGPDRRTGRNATATAGPTFRRASREVSIWGRLAGTLTSTSASRATWVTRDMSASAIPLDATNRHSAAWSRTRRSSSPIRPRTGSRLAAIVGSEACT